MPHDLTQDVTVRVFSEKKEKIQKLIETLENNYIVTHSPEIKWNEEHEDFEVWLYLLHKDTLEKELVTTNG